MKRQAIALLIITILLVSMIPAGTSAAANGARVSLPGFDVFLNGVKVENSYRRYPLIVYKDITYFPMTYYDCRFLGIETNFPMTWRFGVGEFGWQYEFDSQNGLVIQSPNRRLEKEDLSGYNDGPVMVSDGHIYYGGPDGGIYQQDLRGYHRQGKSGSAAGTQQPFYKA